jgi:DNA repair protein RadA/Sms
LEKKLKIPFYNCDVYVNVVGGLKIDGTFGDLGLAVALISSAKSKEIVLDNFLAIGEVGLTGEVRPVSYCGRIVNEAEKMGFKNIIVPDRNKEKINAKEINVIGVSSLKEVLNKVF